MIGKLKQVKNGVCKECMLDCENRVSLALFNCLAHKAKITQIVPENRHNTGYACVSLHIKRNVGLSDSCKCNHLIHLRQLFKKV